MERLGQTGRYIRSLVFHTICPLKRSSAVYVTRSEHHTGTSLRFEGHRPGGLCARVNFVVMDNRVRYYPVSPYGPAQTSGRPSYPPFLPGSGQSDGKSLTEREKQLAEMSDRIPDCIPTNQQRCATPACQVEQVESDCANVRTCVVTSSDSAT
jgi:hypothetical protein